jgi:hypothetical protein
VPQPLGDHLDRDAVSERERGVRVAEIVQPDHRQLILPSAFRARITRVVKRRENAPS